VSQIRQATASFLQLAKSTGISVVLVGHVTKSGEVAGPRVLEHMVDAVLHLEGSERADYRMLKSVKNRFGSVAEVGVFTMTDTGLVDVRNPSELFMSSSVVSEGLEGSAVAVVLEGTRPILAEIQCLVGGAINFEGSGKVNPRRTADGFPIQRLLLICAVIEKRLKLALWNRDVYLNVVGGLRVQEPSADLAVAATVISSLTATPIQAATAFIGFIYSSIHYLLIFILNFRRVGTRWRATRWKGYRSQDFRSDQTGV
jgi:DNA repair protein RadA/Sms